MNLPTATDINPNLGDLDQQYALSNFLGKNLEEAEALFRESAITYQEDLMFMGIRAFRFYVQAAINHIRSDSATGDSDIINCFTGILESRLENEATELWPIAEQLAEICNYVLGHYDKFNVTPEIYGDLRPRYLVLQEIFSRQMEK